MLLCEVVEPHGFLPVSQRGGQHHTVDRGMNASDQSAVAWSLSDVSVLAQMGTLGFASIPTSRPVVITLKLSMVSS